MVKAFILSHMSTDLEYREPGLLLVHVYQDPVTSKRHCFPQSSPSSGSYNIPDPLFHDLPEPWEKRVTSMSLLGLSTPPSHILHTPCLCVNHHLLHKVF